MSATEPDKTALPPLPTAEGSPRQERIMGQTRRDTGSQRAAKRRGAAARQCPKCRRGNAVSTDQEWVEGALAGETRACRWPDCRWASFTDYTVSPPRTTTAGDGTEAARETDR